VTLADDYDNKDAGKKRDKNSNWGGYRDYSPHHAVVPNHNILREPPLGRISTRKSPISLEMLNAGRENVDC